MRVYSKFRQIIAHDLSRGLEIIRDVKFKPPLPSDLQSGKYSG